jgi:hypothetical protein
MANVFGHRKGWKDFKNQIVLLGYNHCQQSRPFRDLDVAAWTLPGRAQSSFAAMLARPFVLHDRHEYDAIRKCMARAMFRVQRGVRTKRNES